MIHFARPAVHPPSALKVVWLSGASDPFSAALSEAEERLLSSCGLAEDELVRANFPYAGSVVRRRVPLPLAALSNVLQFLVASTPLLRWVCGRHWRALCCATPYVIVVAGSCGAQLLRALEHATPPGVTVRALALGPVAWRPPRSLELALVGADDGYSRRFARAIPPDLVEACAGVGHMDYLRSDAVTLRVRAWVALQRQRSGGAR